MELLQQELENLKSENNELREKLEFEEGKHKQWKEHATMFHDTLWRMIDHYIIDESN